MKDIRKLCDMFIGARCSIQKFYEGISVVILYKNKVVYQEIFKSYDDITEKVLDDIKEVLLR
jgi:hypothetical protein